MTKTPQLRLNPEAIVGDESLREIARRALAPLGFPFDDLHAEAALLLNQPGPANTSMLSSEAQEIGKPVNVQSITNQA